MCASLCGVYFYSIKKSSTAHSSTPNAVSPNTVSQTILPNIASQNIISQTTIFPNIASQNIISQTTIFPNIVSQNTALNSISPISILNNDPTLFLYYTFGPNTINGTNVGNTINGSLINNAQIVNGAAISTTDFVVGTASMQFVAASSQYIQINPFTTLNNGITFLFWCKVNNTGNWSRIFDFGNGANVQNILIGFPNNQLWCGIHNSSGATDTPLYTEIINDNVWRHFTWIINPDGAYVIYVNGIFYKNIGIVRYPDNVVRNNNYLGKSNWNQDVYLNGAIDDFRMYNRVLSAIEILTIFSNKN
jgi:hypothetical protein